MGKVLARRQGSRSGVVRLSACELGVEGARKRVEGDVVVARLLQPAVVEATSRRLWHTGSLQQEQRSTTRIESGTVYDTQAGCRNLRCHFCMHIT